MKKTNKNWFCVYTNFREEHIAFQELLLQNLHLYFPRYRQTVRHARKTQEKVYPLFPRYFFALHDSIVSFSVLKRTRGLATYIHHSDGTPVCVSQEVIDFLKAREDSHGYIRMNNQRFKSGENIQVIQGPLSSLSAVFLTQKDEERAKIMLDFMGREQILSVPLDYLDRFSF